MLLDAEHGARRNVERSENAARIELRIAEFRTRRSAFDRLWEEALAVAYDILDDCFHSYRVAILFAQWKLRRYELWAERMQVLERDVVAYNALEDSYGARSVYLRSTAHRRRYSQVMREERQSAIFEWTRPRRLIKTPVLLVDPQIIRKKQRREELKEKKLLLLESRRLDCHGKSCEECTEPFCAGAQKDGSSASADTDSLFRESQPHKQPREPAKEKTKKSIFVEKVLRLMRSSSTGL